jgi:hypothetical protein
MKKTIKYFYLAGLMLGLFACEMDNLEGPTAAIKGTIYDHNGAPLQLEQGKGSGSIRMTELSWLEKKDVEIVTPQELNLKNDGTYQNDKLFAGTYLIHPFKGAFYPLDSVEMKTITLKGGSTTSVDFNVVPYLEIEWVGDPEIVTFNTGEHPDNKPAGEYFKASAKFKLVYKTITDENGVKVTLPHPGVLAGTFCVGNTHFVSAGSRIGDYFSTDFAVTNAQEGLTITFIAKRDIEFYGQDYFFRIGFKSKDLDQRFNYTTVKKLSVRK